jgi:transcriptional regulator with XRE-family HTH domain
MGYNCPVRDNCVQQQEVNEEMLPYGKIRSVAQLGQLVRRRRREAGVLQADAAALAGVGVRFLSELERGKESAEVGRVFQVLERLGLEVVVVPRGWSARLGDGESEVVDG